MSKAVGMRGQPRIYLCGFPKAGLHMLEQAISAVSMPAAKNNWVGTQAWQDTPLQEHVDTMLYKVSLIYPGTYAKGHMGYESSYAELLWGLGISVIFIYRDLRDIVVSQAHHILKAEPDKTKVLRHPNPDPYKALPTFEDVLIACIEGLDIYPGIFSRFAAFAGWLNRPEVYSVRFEDLRKKGHQTCAGIAQHCYAMNGITLPDKDRYKMASGMQRRTLKRKTAKTFRSGQTGGWRDAFTPRVTDCFKAHDPGWLVELGYAQNEEW